VHNNAINNALCALIVMGVSGSGKSTIAAALAERLGWPYEDGDKFHPRSNVEKMKAGHPLTDADRLPWLQAIAAEIERIGKSRQHVIIACSALKRSYRDILVHGRHDVRLIYLDGNRELIASRWKFRRRTSTLLLRLLMPAFRPSLRPSCKNSTPRLAETMLDRETSCVRLGVSRGAFCSRKSSELNYFVRCIAGFRVGEVALQRLWAVLIKAICVSACGKLPVMRLSPASYSSDNKPRSLATATTRSNKSLASLIRPASR